jgi:hypothetical protein
MSTESQALERPISSLQEYVSRIKGPGHVKSYAQLHDTNMVSNSKLYQRKYLVKHIPIFFNGTGELGLDVKAKMEDILPKSGGTDSSFAPGMYSSYGSSTHLLQRGVFERNNTLSRSRSRFSNDPDGDILENHRSKTGVIGIKCLCSHRVSRFVATGRACV